MKLILKFILVITIFLSFSCNKDNSIPDYLKIPEHCVVPKDFANNKFIDFKPSKYLIQVPNGYNGQGIEPNIEGYTFRKYNKDEGVTSLSDYNVFMFYDYCNLTTCPTYGNTLNTIIPDFVFSRNFANETLDIKVEICDSFDSYGYFYYSKEPIFQGKLLVGQHYMNVDGKFTESVTFFFKKEKLQEVISIIRSIKKTE